MKLWSKFRKSSRCHTSKRLTILVFHLVICQPPLFPRMHLDKCRGNKIKTLAACQHYIKGALFPISKQYFYVNYYSSTYCAYTEKKIIFSHLILILSIQSTTQRWIHWIEGHFKWTQSFFLNWRVKFLFSQNCFDFHFQCISRIKKKMLHCFIEM